MLELEPPLRDEYLLAPYVWRDGEQFRILIRVVPRVDEPALKISRVHAGVSQDGLRFTIEGQPILARSDDNNADDHDGCEDPSVAFDSETYYAYYSGWNQNRGEGQLMLATGESVERLRKQGVVIASNEARKNPKEATIVRASDGTWRLFFEYAAGGRSQVAFAKAKTIAGPWEILPDPFSTRVGSFDDRHISPGPIVGTTTPVMFYNGANDKTRWRVGWVAFDECYTRVVDRCVGSLIVPPRPADGETDIAFVASAVQDADVIALYYHVADQHPHRALVRRIDLGAPLS